MDRKAILESFDRLAIWSRGDQRAPHKPLLVLYALGRWQRGQLDVTFVEAEPELTALLREFGPPRRSDHPEQPFWRLQNDGVWTVHAPANLPMKTGDDIPRITSLRSPEVRAEFSPEVQASLRSDPSLTSDIAARLLGRHFPDSIHQDILAAVGLELGVYATDRTRDPKFRQKVLVAYEWRCAVCGFDVSSRRFPWPVVNADYRDGVSGHQGVASAKEVNGRARTCHFFGSPNSISETTNRGDHEPCIDKSR